MLRWTAGHSRARRWLRHASLSAESVRDWRSVFAQSLAEAPPPCHGCAGTGALLCLHLRWHWAYPATSALGLGLTHTCSRTGRTPATFEQQLGSPLPHPHRNWAHPRRHQSLGCAHSCHIRTGTGWLLGSPPPTSARGLGSPAPTSALAVQPVVPIETVGKLLAELYPLSAPSAGTVASTLRSAPSGRPPRIPAPSGRPTPSGSRRAALQPTARARSSATSSSRSSARLAAASTFGGQAFYTASAIYRCMPRHSCHK